MGYQKIDQSWISVTGSIVKRIEFLSLSGRSIQPRSNKFFHSFINIPDRLLWQLLISIQFQSIILFKSELVSLLLRYELDSEL